MRFSRFVAVSAALVSVAARPLSFDVRTHNFRFAAGHTRDASLHQAPWTAGGELLPVEGVGYRLDSTVKSHPYINAHSTTSGALRVQLVASYEKLDGWMTVFDFDGFVFTIHPLLVDIGPDEERPMLVSNVGTVSSTHKGAEHVAHAFKLIPKHRGYASWTPQRPRTITFVINADGTLEVPTIDGLAFERILFPYDPLWAPKPVPFVLGGESKLVLGSTFSVPGWRSNFTGTISRVSVEPLD